MRVTRELLTRDDYWEAVFSGEGVIVIVDQPKRTTTAHPVSCPTLDASNFVEKVITNGRRNGSYHWASSQEEARRVLDSEPCHCP